MARPLLRALPTATCVLGLVADIGIGVAILRGAAAGVLLLHPFAVGAWVIGMRAMQRTEAQGDAPAAHPRAIRPLVLGLAALALFPGFAVTGWAAGVAFSRLPLARRARLAPTLPQDDDAPSAVALPAAAPDAPWVAIGVQPLADVLREPDPAIRRAAIRVLGAEPARDAIRLLQALLVDPHPDVRSEASATLFRFENQLNRALADAIAAARAEPENAERHAAVATEYRRYVACDLLDPASARLYRTRAAEALGHATERAPDRADLWFALARVQHERGEVAAAAAALDRATALGIEGADATLLRMEIAYHAQEWDTLTQLTWDDDAHDTHRWWRGAMPPAATTRPPQAAMAAHAGHAGHEG